MSGVALPLALTAWRRRSRRWAKEIVLGLALAGLFGVVSATAPVWLLAVLLAYGTLVQLVAMTDNDVFLRHDDLLRLGLKVPSRQASATYLAHYLAVDWTLSHLLGLAGLLVGTLVQGTWWAAAAVVASYALVLLPLPSIVWFSRRASTATRTAFYGALTVVALGSIAMALLAPQVILTRMPWVAPTLLAVMVVEIGLLRTCARRGSAVQLHTSVARQILSPLRRWPLLHKDLLLVGGSAVTVMLGGCALLALLAVGSAPALLPCLTLVAFQDNPLLAKSRSRFILAQDPLFCVEQLPADARTLRRAQARTLLLFPVLLVLLVVMVGAVVGSMTWMRFAIVLLTAVCLWAVDVQRLAWPSIPGAAWRSAGRYAILGLGAAGMALPTDVQPMVAVALLVACLMEGGPVRRSLQGSVPQSVTRATSTVAVPKDGRPAAQHSVQPIH